MRNKYEKTQEAWIDDGVDVKRRKLSIFTEIDEYEMAKYVRALDLLESISDDPIEVNISSFGGCVYSGLALFSRLVSSPCDITTIAQGKVMSMGLILFMAGDDRVCDKYTTLMAHQVSSVTVGKLTDLEVDVTETKRLNDMLMEILGERSDKPTKWWKQQTKHEDKYYSAEKAKELGVVPDVI